ncbi:hypothetical protein CEXT_566691 [Caerostris extrusa]|uniref:Ribosomal protein S10 n=1 Tax=Caerostris extrusa TaxID=172846 RepID=A0AAV4WKC2_CAEEX|nr:hypothetical protein CEXT_566691 [Caerostris extrusa]
MPHKNSFSDNPIYMLKYYRHCLKPSLFQSLHLHIHASTLTKVFQHPFQILKQEKQKSFHSNIRHSRTKNTETTTPDDPRQKFTFRTKNKEKRDTDIRIFRSLEIVLHCLERIRQQMCVRSIRMKS